MSESVAVVYPDGASPGIDDIVAEGQDLQILIATQQRAALHHGWGIGHTVGGWDVLFGETSGSVCAPAVGQA